MGDCIQSCAERKQVCSVKSYDVIRLYIGKGRAVERKVNFSVNQCIRAQFRHAVGGCKESAQVSDDLSRDLYFLGATHDVSVGQCVLFATDEAFGNDDGQGAALL